LGRIQDLLLRQETQHGCNDVSAVFQYISH
jgi:hypothetical protein